MSDIPTPITDAADSLCGVSGSVSRQLERRAIVAEKERDQLRAEVERLSNQFGACSTCGNCSWVTRADGVTEDCEFCKLREERDQWRECATLLRDELLASVSCYHLGMTDRKAVLAAYDKLLKGTK
jgi:hypothetical protein